VQELCTVVRKPQVLRLCVAESYTAGTLSPEFFRRRCLPFEPLAVVVARESALVLQLGSKRRVLHPDAFSVANRALGLLFRATPTILPPRAAFSGEPAADRPLVDVPGRPPCDLWFRSCPARQRVGQLESNLS
jgi:hypothetical protein